MQSQNAVTAYFTSKQLLYFGLQSWIMCDSSEQLETANHHRPDKLFTFSLSVQVTLDYNRKTITHIREASYQQTLAYV